MSLQVRTKEDVRVTKSNPENGEMRIYIISTDDRFHFSVTGDGPYSSTVSFYLDPQEMAQLADLLGGLATGRR